MTDGRTNEQTNNAVSRVAFATENQENYNENGNFLFLKKLITCYKFMIYMIVVVNSVTKPNLDENQVESNVTTSRQT